MHRIPINALLILSKTAILLVPQQTSAISRISSIANSCADLHNFIDREGAAIVTHPGTRSSGILYDRYVRDSAKCDSGYIAQDDWVPAKGGSCRLQNCQPFEPPFDD